MQIKRLLVAALAAGVLAMSAAWAAVGLGDSIGFPSGFYTDGHFEPHHLPADSRAPVRLTLSGSVVTEDGAMPPPPRAFTIDLDKSFRLTTAGIATCGRGRLRGTTSRQAIKRCGKALIGRGTTKAIVDFDDQAPFDAIGPLLIFNGKPRGGRPTVLFHVSAKVPTRRTYVAQSRVLPSPRRGYGGRIVVDVPPIAHGNGALVSFEITIKKHPVGGGSYLQARCAKGHLGVGMTAELGGGSDLSSDLVRRCRGI